MVIRKAIILFRKNKLKQQNIYYNIFQTLLRHKFIIEIQPYPFWKPVYCDLLIQWSYKRHSLGWIDKFREINPNLRNIMLDNGWIDRENTILLYDHKCNRININQRERKPEYYKKDLGERRPSKWLLVLQVPKDANLRKCGSVEDYNNWIKKMLNTLRIGTTRDIAVRKHPRDQSGMINIGWNEFSDKSLEDDLRDAIGVVTWSSSTAIKAMFSDIPVCVYDIPEIRGLVQTELTIAWMKKVENQLPVNYGRALNILISQQIEVRSLPYLNIDLIYRELKG